MNSKEAKKKTIAKWKGICLLYADLHSMMGEECALCELFSLKHDDCPAFEICRAENGIYTKILHTADQLLRLLDEGIEQLEKITEKKVT